MTTKDKSNSVRQQGRHGTGTAAKKRRASSVKRIPAEKSQSKRVAQPRQPSPDVVYTQPGPFNRNRFILHILTVAAVVLALLFGMSIFFKVETVTVTGFSKYTEWDIMEASGIQKGENLLTLSETKISSNIISKLPYVDSVRIGIKLPDTVKIEIVELEVAYALEAYDGSWWLMRADGRLLEKINSADADLYTKVLGVQLNKPAAGESAAAYQPVSDETTPEGETVPVTVNAAQQLDTAVSILQFLEDHGILGEMASVDVTDLNDLQMWYGGRFQVLLGDETQLSYKIGLIKTAVDVHMESYNSGILDASLTVQPDPEQEYQVIYTPFDTN